MTCKDCIHYNACNTYERLMLTIDSQFELIYQKGVEKSCENFKNKADFVEVVRCKDCKYNDNGGCICPDNIAHSYDSEWYEYEHYISIYSDHYCGYGERRDT